VNHPEHREEILQYILAAPFAYVNKMYPLDKYSSLKEEIFKKEKEDCNNSFLDEVKKD
jgi:hypothetical protein